MTSPSSHYLKLHGLRFHYLEWGSADAPAIVLLHGLRAFARTWSAVAHHFQGRYRLLALDQRGRGETDWDPEANYYTDAYVADVEAFVDALELERFTLVGHSMGGTTTYVYTAAHPGRVERAVVEDIGPGSSVRGAGFERIVREMKQTPASFGGWEQARRYWRGLRASASEEAIDQRVGETMREEPDGTIVWRFDWDGIRNTRVEPDPDRIVDLWPVVDALARPVLVLRGALSDFLPRETCEAMAARNANVRWEEIPGASHYAHDDNFPAFVSEVEAFMNETS